MEKLAGETLFSVPLTPDLGELGETHPPPQKRRRGPKGPDEPLTAQEYEKQEKRKQATIGRPPPVLPRAYATMKGTGAEELGFNDTAQYLRLQMFLQKNGGLDVGPSRADGSCMFSSVLALLGSCQEYTQVHLRRDLVLLGAEYPEFLFHQLKEHIRHEYTQPRLTKEEYERKKADDTLTIEEHRLYHMPGPLSYYAWLLYMLEPDAWGDAATLILMSYKLQVPMATVDADDLFVRRYRQEWPLEMQEIVLCYQNKNHYLPCSE